MNDLSTFEFKRKVGISIVLGLLSLIFAPYGVVAILGEVTIDIPWSLVLPILAAMAFGWRYGIIAGLAGGALFPFFLWENNGWANVFTAIAFLFIYTLSGLLYDTSSFKNIKKLPLRFLFVILASILPLCYYFIFQFNTVLAFNPPFWEQDAIQNLPIETLYSFAFKDSINILILILVSESLLKLPLICRLLGFPIKKQMQANNKIFVASILASLFIWLLFAGLSFALLNGTHSLNDEHNSLALLVILSCGIFVSRMFFYYSENQFIIQAELNSSKKKYHELFEANKDGITIFYGYPNGKLSNFLEMNESAGIMLGYTKAELTAMNPSEIEIDGTEEKIALRLSDLQTKGFSSFQTNLKHKNGNHVPVEITLMYINYNNLPALMSITRDITERKKAEEALKKSEHFLKEAQVIAQLGIFTLDIASGKWESSDVLDDIFGIDADYDRSFKGWSAIVHPEWQKIVDDYFMNEVIGTKTDFDKEYQIIRKNDKAERWVHGIGRLKVSADNRVITMLGTIRDITERKHSEVELTKAKEHAEESDRLKTAFLTNMSHEIRTPMNGILGFAELLKMPGLSGEQQQEYIGIIKKSGARMLNIITDIVDISKIEAGQIQLSVLDTKINEQTKDIYNLFKPEAENKGIQFSCINGLPDSKSVIKTDDEKVYAILTNLVKNAIKYTDSGSIEFGYILEGSYVHNGIPDKKSEKQAEIVFYVKDTGIGIPANRQHAIFDRFVQADIADIRALQGAGLGLSISKAYVKMLDGKIWTESEEGIGSTFYFSIPFIPSVNGSGDIENEVVPVLIADKIKKLKILIVEDDETSEILIRIAVRNFSDNILLATTGVKAIELCRNNFDIDLVLMDIKMAEMDGYEATRQIRIFNKEVVIIAQTAFGMEGDREKALDAGCNDYISKPLDIAILKELIAEHFS